MDSFTIKYYPYKNKSSLLFTLHSTNLNISDDYFDYLKMFVMITNHSESGMLRIFCNPISMAITLRALKHVTTKYQITPQVKVHKNIKELYDYVIAKATELKDVDTLGYTAVPALREAYDNGVIPEEQIFKEIEPEIKLPLLLHQKYYVLTSTFLKQVVMFGEMGVGKTAAAIHAFTLMKHLGQGQTCVVVVPNSIKFNWAGDEKAEIEKHSHHKAMVLHGSKKQRDKQIKDFKYIGSGFLITSYSFWSGNNELQFEEIRKCKPDMVICDESHKMKNETAKTTKHISKYLKYAPYKTLLTATPNPNNHTDIFTQYRFIQALYVPQTFFQFCKLYFTSYESGFKTVYNLKDDKASTFRRIIGSKGLVFKSEECIELPEKEMITTYVDTVPEYKAQLEHLSLDLFKPEQAIRLQSHLTRLLTACSGFLYDTNKQGIEFKKNPKAEVLSEILESIINSGSKAIVWYDWTHDVEVLKKLMQKLKIKSYIIHKELDTEERLAVIRAFEDDPKPSVLITSLRLTSVGVNIISAKYAIYYSYDFNFENYYQSEGRNRRIGSKALHDKVIYIRLVMKDTIEEVVDRVLKLKLGYNEFIFGVRDTIKKSNTIRK